MNTNTNYHNLRDSKGRFAPKSQSLARKTRTVNYHNVRDSKGRFVSAVQQKQATAVIQNSVKASFIKSLVVSGKTVEVVMNRYPSIKYIYTPIPANLKGIKDAIVNGTSLGVAYNKFLRGTDMVRNPV